MFSRLFSRVTLLARSPSDLSSIVAMAETRCHPRRLTGCVYVCVWGGIGVASVSPEACVEVKQLSVAEGREAGADSGEVGLTGSY